MFLICGLGNPGEKYKDTRHNIGFKLIEKLVLDYSFKKHKEDKTKEVFKGNIKKNNIFLIKPLLFMNQSGSPIKDITNFYKIKNINTFVVHDDLDLNLGKIKSKIGGGNGGHKGLISIDSLIGKNYNRLRIGISRPKIKSLVSSYVLKRSGGDRAVAEACLYILRKFFRIKDFSKINLRNSKMSGSWKI